MASYTSFRIRQRFVLVIKQAVPHRKNYLDCQYATNGIARLSFGNYEVLNE